MKENAKAFAKKESCRSLQGSVADLLPLVPEAPCKKRRLRTRYSAPKRSAAAQRQAIRVVTRFFVSERRAFYYFSALMCGKTQRERKGFYGKRKLYSQPN